MTSRVKGYDLRVKGYDLKVKKIPPRHGTFGKKILPRHGTFGKRYHLGMVHLAKRYHLSMVHLAKRYHLSMVHLAKRYHLSMVHLAKRYHLKEKYTMVSMVHFVKGTKLFDERYQAFFERYQGKTAKVPSSLVPLKIIGGIRIHPLIL